MHICFIKSVWGLRLCISNKFPVGCWPNDLPLRAGEWPLIPANPETYPMTLYKEWRSSGLWSQQLWAEIYQSRKSKIGMTGKAPNIDPWVQLWIKIFLKCFGQRGTKFIKCQPLFSWIYLLLSIDFAWLF